MFYLPILTLNATPLPAPPGFRGFGVPKATPCPLWLRTIHWIVRLTRRAPRNLSNTSCSLLRRKQNCRSQRCYPLQMYYARSGELRLWRCQGQPPRSLWLLAIQWIASLTRRAKSAPSLKSCANLHCLCKQTQCRQTHLFRRFAHNVVCSMYNLSAFFAGVPHNLVLDNHTKCVPRRILGHSQLVPKMLVLYVSRGAPWTPPCGVGSVFERESRWTCYASDLLSVKTVQF